MNNIKVAYMLGSLNRGGTETLILDVFRNADKAPFQFIGIHRKGGAYKDDFYAAGPKMIQCAPKRFGLVRYVLKLRQILIREQITIVHAQQTLDWVYAWLVTIGTGIQVVETFHGYDFEAKWFNKFIVRLSIRIANAVCFVSASERDYYIDAYCIRNTQNLHVVYNGIDFAKIVSAKPSLEFANLFPRIRLAMVGNFVSGRSQNIIVKSIHVLRKRGITNFDFYFIGRRVDAEAWRYDNCVKYCVENRLKNVHFLGGRGDVPALLKVMDGFVYSTDHDTFGIAIVEAIAAGLPIVVNDWSVMQEVCGESNDGIRYFKTDDADDAANKIVELLEHLPESKKAARDNAKIIKEKYSIESHIERLNKVYETCY